LYLKYYTALAGDSDLVTMERLLEMGTLHHSVICVLPVVVNYSSLHTISPHMVVWLFLSWVQLPGLCVEL